MPAARVCVPVCTPSLGCADDSLQPLFSVPETVNSARKQGGEGENFRFRDCARVHISLAKPHVPYTRSHRRCGILSTKKHELPKACQLACILLGLFGRPMFRYFWRVSLGWKKRSWVVQIPCKVVDSDTCRTTWKIRQSENHFDSRCSSSSLRWFTRKNREWNASFKAKLHLNGTNMQFWRRRHGRDHLIVSFCKWVYHTQSGYVMHTIGLHAKTISTSSRKSKSLFHKDANSDKLTARKCAALRPIYSQRTSVFRSTNRFLVNSYLVCKNHKARKTLIRGRYKSIW